MTIKLSSARFVGLTAAELTAYLDGAIRYWRKRKADGDTVAPYYIDAYQSVRESLFGTQLSEGA